MASRGELERAVMAALWERPDGASAQDVRAALGTPEPAVTTVLTVLSRLGAKGMVRREEDGRAHTYFAARSRAEFLGDLMSDALGQADDRGAVLARFVGSMSPDDAASLRRAIRRSRPG